MTEKSDSTVEEDLSQWKAIASSFEQSLPIIDDALSEQNVPLGDRKLKAFQLVCDHLLEIPDWQAFMVSDAHGRFLILVEEWYRNRYGSMAIGSDGKGVIAAVTIHKTPFLLRVPKNFSKPDEEPGHTWIGFPASVQKEEDPLDWIENRAVVKGLSEKDSAALREAIMPMANAVRSIGFDLRALEYDPDPDIVDLAGAVATDLQASARHLCDQSEAGLRASGWDISQACEKSFKIMIRRKGEEPKFTHDLEKLAADVERLGAQSIERTWLAAIPSNSGATSMRYGGRVALSDAIAAYTSGLEIVRQLLFEATPNTRYNVREARFLLRQPPWFDFDTDGFLRALRESSKS